VDSDDDMRELALEESGLLKIAPTMLTEDGEGSELDITHYLRVRDEASGVNLPDSESDEELDVEALARLGAELANDSEESSDEEMEMSDSDEGSDSESDHSSDHSAYRFFRSRRDPTRKSPSVFKTVDVVHPRRMFIGARNVETVKDCEYGWKDCRWVEPVSYLHHLNPAHAPGNFLGDGSDKVCSGSDDGNFFLWDKLTGRLEGIWKGDNDVVNGELAWEDMSELTRSRRAAPDPPPRGRQRHRPYRQSKPTVIKPPNVSQMFAPLSAPPVIPMTRMADQARILRRNGRRRTMQFEPTSESNALQILSQIIAARRAANPNLTGREHLLQLFTEGSARRDDEADGEGRGGPGDGGARTAGAGAGPGVDDPQCPLQ
jgi:hypothetical protein